MGKNLPRTIIYLLSVLAFLFFLFILISPQTYAHHRSKILGVSTDPSNLQIPATVEGPGLILPDSSLFFLDKLKQNTRLFTAINHEKKAKIYVSIAGERMAELRFMLSKNNEDGIRLTLDGVSENLKSASDELKKAKLRGKDVSKIAREININIKEKQDILDALEIQVQGEIKARVRASQEAILLAKVEIEENLPEDELENEIRDDLRRLTAKKFREITEYSEELQRDLEELNLQASEVANKSLKAREEALKIAIKEKNEELKKVNEKLVLEEKKKQVSYLIAAKEAREAVKEAQSAALRFERSQNLATQVLNDSIIPTPIPTP